MTEPRRAHWMLGDALLVARHEFAEAVRTRRLIVMLFLFVGGGALGAWGFTRFVGRFEAEAARVMATKTGDRPGHTIEVLRNAPIYRTMIKAAVGSEKKAEYLVGLPPMTTLPPRQMAISGPALAVGAGLTVTRTESVAVQPMESVTMTE